MILIADSGSTKTDWCMVDGKEKVGVVTTQGINPFHQDDEEIQRILHVELMPKMADRKVEAVFFYGAGLRQEMKDRMKGVLGKAFEGVDVEAESDLLGAARALFGRQSGVACILGTGSNSGLYDGQDIIANTPPLGYILGDEGSGAVLGKAFLGALCKGLLPKDLTTAFFQSSGLDTAAIIQAVYRQPLPNRFLASTTRFIHEHLQVPELRDLVLQNFRLFFQRNLVPYGGLGFKAGADAHGFKADSDCKVFEDGAVSHGFKVRAVGSIAYYFSELLAEAAQVEGFSLDLVMQSPMEGLVRFHS